MSTPWDTASRVLRRHAQGVRMIRLGLPSDLEQPERDHVVLLLNNFNCTAHIDGDVLWCRWHGEIQ